MISMAQDLGFRVVAEGVEGWPAYQLLAQLGCDEAQGYVLAKPMPLADFNEWLETNRQADSPLRPEAAISL